jgi:ABC-type antimicrobial peptide transport system permease subunit
MAVTVSAAGLVAGIPVGYATGRLVWWAVAESVGIDTDAVFPLVAVAVTVPLVVLLAVVVAWLPAQRSGRRSPAVALRAE